MFIKIKTKSDRVEYINSENITKVIEVLYEDDEKLKFGKRDHFKVLLSFGEDYMIFYHESNQEFQAYFRNNQWR